MECGNSLPLLVSRDLSRPDQKLPRKPRRKALHTKAATSRRTPNFSRPRVAGFLSCARTDSRHADSKANSNVDLFPLVFDSRSCGLSWQITPTILPELLKSKDAEKAQRVMKAMLQMKKIDIPTIKRAAEGE